MCSQLSRAGRERAAQHRLPGAGAGGTGVLREPTSPSQEAGGPPSMDRQEEEQVGGTHSSASGIRFSLYRHCRRFSRLK